MRASPGMEFLTSDQPVINTYGAFISPTTPVDELALYYPVSPTRALIVSGHGAYRGIHGKTLEPIRTNYLNQAIERIAHEQIFGKSAGSLTLLAPRFCY